jgi:hypothetical protein
MKAKRIFEDINDILKPKSNDEIEKLFFKGPGFYGLMLEFSNNIGDDSYLFQFLSIKNKEELTEYLAKYNDAFKDIEYIISLIKFDISKNSRIDIYPSQGIEILHHGSPYNIDNESPQIIINKKTHGG